MDKRIDTLVVLATNRAAAILDDQLAAYRWSFSGPYHVVVVDDAGYGTAGDHGDHTIVRSRVPGQKHLSGFKNHEGLRYAVDAGIDFDVAMVTDDDSLPIGRGLDAWALATMAAGAIDLLGVGDRVDYAPHWGRWAGRFAAWVPESAQFFPDAATLFYATTWMSRHLVDDLATRNCLLPPGHEAWDLWPDVYISWMAQVLGHHCVAHGTMDAPEPPLWLNHGDWMRGAPQPWALRPEYLIYHTIRAVPGASEEVVRARYAAIRAADA